MINFIRASLYTFEIRQIANDFYRTNRINFCAAIRIYCVFIFLDDKDSFSNAVYTICIYILYVYIILKLEPVVGLYYFKMKINNLCKYVVFIYKTT